MDWTQIKPAKVNIVAYQGVTFRRKYGLRMSDGTPFPFKDELGVIAWKAEAEIRPDVESQVLYARMTTQGGITIAQTETESSYTLEISDLVMDTMPAGKHVLDVTLIAPNGDSIPVQGGTFELRGRATERKLDVS